MQLFVANPPKSKRPKHTPKAKKKTNRTPSKKDSTVANKNHKNKTPKTPKPRKSRNKSGGGGFTAGSRGFLNVDLLLLGAAAGAGNIGATIIAPKVGSMLAGVTAGYSNQPVGQMAIKAVSGLATAWLGYRFLPGKFKRLSVAAGVGMLSSAAVDVYGMVRPDSFVRGAISGNGLAGYLTSANPLPYYGATGGQGMVSPYNRAA